MLILLAAAAMAADLAVGLEAPERLVLEDPGLTSHQRVTVGRQGRLEIAAGLPRITELRSQGAVEVRAGALTVDHLSSTGVVRVLGGSLALDQVEGDVLVTEGALTLAPAAQVDGTVTLQGGLLAARTPARVRALHADADSELQLVGGGLIEVTDDAVLSGHLVISPAIPCGQPRAVLQAAHLTWSGTAEGLDASVDGNRLLVEAPCPSPSSSPPAAACSCAAGPSAAGLLMLPLLALSRRRA